MESGNGDNRCLALRLRGEKMGQKLNGTERQTNNFGAMGLYYIVCGHH